MDKWIEKNGFIVTRYPLKAWKKVIAMVFNQEAARLIVNLPLFIRTITAVDTMFKTVGSMEKRVEAKRLVKKSMEEINAKS